LNRGRIQGDRKVSKGRAVSLRPLQPEADPPSEDAGERFGEGVFSRVALIPAFSQREKEKNVDAGMK